MIPNDDGRDCRTLRSQKWMTQRCCVTLQEMRIREERRVLFSQRKWKEAEAHLLFSLPVTLDRVKHGQTMDSTSMATSKTSMEYNEHKNNGKVLSYISKFVYASAALSASATLQCTMEWYRKDLEQLV